LIIHLGINCDRKWNTNPVSAKVISLEIKFAVVQNPGSFAVYFLFFNDQSRYLRDYLERDKEIATTNEFFSAQCKMIMQRVTKSFFCLESRVLTIIFFIRMSIQNC
jgi:hypothetical protein